MFHSYDHGGNVFAVACSLGVKPEQICDFSASINPLGMSPNVRKDLSNSLDGLVHYPDSSHGELKQVLGEHHDLLPEHLTIANGSTELIYHLPILLPGKKALIISPSFSEYERSLVLHGWEVHHFILTPESGFTIDTDRLEQVVNGGFELLYCCNPGNPHGVLYPLQVVETIIRICGAAGTFLVLDEAFMDFCEEGSAKHLITTNERAVVLRSMTKFFGIPGLRLGYAISNSALAKQLDVMGGPWSVNSLALSAGTAALRDKEHNQNTLDYIREERHTLHTKLEQFKQFGVFPSCVNYLLIEIRNGMTVGELQKRLLPSRILIRNCGSFVGLSDRFFRIAVRTVQENRMLLESLEGVMNLMAEK